MIRPVAEYCSSVYHTLTSKADSLELDRIQMQALKSIYGWQYSYNELLEKSSLDRLDLRRENRFVELAKKIHQDYRYKTWFPLKLARRADLRDTGEKFKIYHSASERYSNSPLNQMRRRLNAFYSV